MAINALLLSAGLGTRLRPYTYTLPKPAIPFWGLPMCYYSLYLLHQLQSHKITMNLHHLPDILTQLTKAYELQDFQFNFSLEKEKPQGSGGALFYAKNFLRDTPSFFAVNSDEVMVPSTDSILQKLAEHHQKTQSLATLLVTDHPELGKTFKPVWVNQEGVVRAFGERPDTKETLRPVHYIGYKIFDRKVLDLIPAGESHIFHDVLVPAMTRGALVNTLFDACQWWETGSFSSFLAATGDINQQISEQKNQHYIHRVYRYFEKNMDFDFQSHKNTNLAIHRSVQNENTTFKGVVFVDENADLQNGFTIENSIINKNCRLNSSVSQQMIFKETL